MQRRLTFVALLLALFLLNACQTTATIKTTDLIANQEPVRVKPVDVQAKFITTQAISPQALEVSAGNLFSNGGFESELEGWTACSTGAIQSSTDAYEGTGALEVIPNNCFYRSTEVSPGQDLVLSCYVKVTSGSKWTGMGMGFADSSWTTVGEAPATVISGSAYARYDVEFTAPANSKYASMWLYSDNAVVVDNCSLMLEATPPPPPPPSGGNLLENGNFETLSSGNPTEWSQGCGGSASSVVGREGKGFNLKGGICVDQGLSAGDVAALSGNDYTYSCYAKNTGGYASLSIFFNDAPVSKVIPVSNSFQLVELKGTAPQASSGFVSIYSEANLIVDQCSLTVGDVAPPPPPPPSGGSNLLENGGFETLNANSNPVNWNKGCGGSYDRVVGRSGNGLSLTGGACVDQPLSSSDLAMLANQQYTYSCYAKNTGGYASMSIFFDDVPVSTVIPQSSDFQLVEVTGVAPSAGSGFVSIYSEAGLTVDDCSVNASSTIDVVIIEPITTIVDPSNPSTDSVSRFGRGHDIEGTTIAVGDTPNGDFYVYELINGQWVKTFVDEELQTNGSTYIAISEDESIIIVAGFLRSSNTGTNDVIYQKNSQGVWEKVKVLDESAVTNVSIGNDLITTGGSLWGRNEGGANNWGLIRSFGSNVAHLNENTLVTYQSAGLSIYEKDAGGINNWGQVAQIPLDFQARDVILTQNSLAVLDFNSPRVEIYDRVNSMSWEKSGEIQLLTPSTSSLSFDFDENVLVLPQDDKVYIYEKNTSNGIWENIARTTSQSIVRNVALDCSTVTYSLEENTGSSLNLVDIPRSTPCP